MGKPRVLKPCRRQVTMKFEAPDDLIPADHMARVFDRVVQWLDVSKLLAGVRAVEHGGGRPVFCPGMLLTLWLYATWRAIGSAREIERLVRSDDGFKWIVGDLDVGRFAINDFRVAHGEALLDLMADVLASLMHKGMLPLDVMALDGTRVRAAASAPSFRRFESLLECRDQAALHLKAVFADADNPDVTRAQQVAREAAARDIVRRTDEALVAVAELQQGRGPKERQARASTTDVDARVMKMPDGGFRPAYNIQLAVVGKDTGGPRTIVGVEVTNVGSDMGAVTRMIDEIKENTGASPERLLADGNHARHGCIEYADAQGIDLLVPPGKKSKANASDSPAVTRWRDRMTTDDAKRAYRARAALVELTNAHLKTHFGLDHVLVRGTGKVLCVALIAAMTFNIAQNAAALLA